MTNVVVATSAAGLKILVPSPTNAQAAVIRIGSGTDTTDIPLSYNTELTKWIGRSFELIRSVDQVDAQCKPTYTTKQILSENTNNAIAGGDVLWHFSSYWRIGETLGAGLGLEYRQQALILAAKSPFKKANIGACLFPVEEGDTRVTAPGSAWGETTFMLGGREWPGAVPVYEWENEGWQELKSPGGGSLAATTKKGVAAGVYGFMESGATEGGGVTSYALWLRWTI